MYINKEQRWGVDSIRFPLPFALSKSWKDGGGAGWGVDSIRFPLPSALSTSWKDGGGVKFLHIERKITSVVHSHPPSHYIRKHAPGGVDDV